MHAHRHRTTTASLGLIAVVFSSSAVSAPSTASRRSRCCMRRRRGAAWSSRWSNAARPMTRTTTGTRSRWRIGSSPSWAGSTVRTRGVGSRARPTQTSSTWWLVARHTTAACALRTLRPGAPSGSTRRPAASSRTVRKRQASSGSRRPPSSASRASARRTATSSLGIQRPKHGGSLLLDGVRLPPPRVEAVEPASRHLDELKPSWVRLLAVGIWPISCHLPDLNRRGGAHTAGNRQSLRPRWRPGPPGAPHGADLKPDTGAILAIRKIQLWSVDRAEGKLSATAGRAQGSNGGRAHGC